MSKEMKGTTGVFIRVQRLNRWENIDLADLTVYEFMQWFKTLDIKAQLKALAYCWALIEPDPLKAKK